jgi:hypothetical protein
VRVVEAGLVDPRSRDFFGPLDPLTTEELATIEHRIQVAAGGKDLGGDPAPADAGLAAVDATATASDASVVTTSSAAQETTTTTQKTTSTTARKTTGSAQKAPVATRLDLADTLVRLAHDLYGYPPAVVPQADTPPVAFADVPSAAGDTVRAVVAMGLMSAKTIGPGGAVTAARFDPWGSVTRLQAVRAVDRLMALQPAPGLLTPFLLYQTTGAFSAFGS